MAVGAPAQRPHLTFSEGHSSTNKEKDLRYDQHMVWAYYSLTVHTYSRQVLRYPPALTTSVRSHNNHQTSNGREGGRGDKGEGVFLFGRGVCG